MEQTHDVWDYFSGYVPAYCVFHMQLGGILELLRTPPTEHNRTVDELALIGVVAYTEAFFRDHFASILNVFPEKVSLLKKGNLDISIDLSDLLELDPPWLNKFGFLLSERYKFGTPNDVNGNYFNLLQIRPFSKDKAENFNKVLTIRHLLVHHGGSITPRFNKTVPSVARDRAFVDSVPVTRCVVGKAAIMANDVASSTARATISRLKAEIDSTQSTNLRKQAIELMGEFLDRSDALTADLRSACVLEPSVRSNETGLDGG